MDNRLFTNNSEDYPLHPYYKLVNIISRGEVNRKKVFTIARCMDLSVQEVEGLIRSARMHGNIIALEDGCCFIPNSMKELEDHRKSIDYELQSILIRYANTFYDEQEDDAARACYDKQIRELRYYKEVIGDVIRAIRDDSIRNIRTN